MGSHRNKKRKRRGANIHICPPETANVARKSHKLSYNDPVATYSTLGVECYSAENTSKMLVSGSLKWEIPSIIKLEQ